MTFRHRVASKHYITLSDVTLLYRVASKHYITLSDVTLLYRNGMGQNGILLYKRKKGKTVILTDYPYKNELQESINEKEEKETEKERKKKEKDEKNRVN
ncbi:hypothetical protein J6590_038775 [Homalodisca vitripennis]|nr:hypothetical protein J6590_038775 [Homalodisca vitripennis]